MRRVFALVFAAVRAVAALGIRAALGALIVAVALPLAGVVGGAAAALDGRAVSSLAGIHAALAVLEVAGFAWLAIASLRDAWRTLAEARVAGAAPAGEESEGVEVSRALGARLWLVAGLIALMLLRAASAPALEREALPATPASGDGARIDLSRAGT